MSSSAVRPQRRGLARTLTIFAASATFGLLVVAFPVAARAGEVTGTVKGSDIPPKPAPSKLAKDVAVCGAEHPSDALVVGDGGALANVVVSLKPVNAKTPVKPPAPGHASVDQVGCRYAPHVQAVSVGTELTLVNSDRVLHNVHANVGPVTVFNVAMPIKGQRLPTKLTRPGLVRLQCDAGHTWMNAWLYVSDQPYFAVTDAKGHFAIHDVPAGEYTVEYWHEPLDGTGPGMTKTAKVTVADGNATADATLSLGKGPVAGAGATGWQVGRRGDRCAPA